MSHLHGPPFGWSCSHNNWLVMMSMQQEAIHWRRYKWDHVIYICMLEHHIDIHILTYDIYIYVRPMYGEYPKSWERYGLTSGSPTYLHVLDPEILVEMACIQSQLLWCSIQWDEYDSPSKSVYRKMWHDGGFDWNFVDEYPQIDLDVCHTASFGLDQFHIGDPQFHEDYFNLVFSVFPASYRNLWKTIDYECCQKAYCRLTHVYRFFDSCTVPIKWSWFWFLQNCKLLPEKHKFTAAKTSLANQKSLGLLVKYIQWYGHSLRNFTRWNLPRRICSWTSPFPDWQSGQARSRLQMDDTIWATIPYHIQMIGITMINSKDAVNGFKRRYEMITEFQVVSSLCLCWTLYGLKLQSSPYRRFMRIKLIWNAPQQKHGLLKMGESDNK